MATRTDRAMTSRNNWDAKLRRRGHRPKWQQISNWPAKRYLGTCTRCGGMVECGTGRAWTGGVAGSCQPVRRLFPGRR